jgi:hypothetical protein
MTRTYGLIGTRADLGGALASEHLRTLWGRIAHDEVWGLGSYVMDEILLRRGPGGAQPRLVAELSETRAHAFLAQSASSDTLPTPADSPPLRYGHLLFAADGVTPGMTEIVSQARTLLPATLARTVSGEGFCDLAFALFLSDLPMGTLARTRLGEPRRSVNPVRKAAIASALRGSLTILDRLCKSEGIPRFTGTLWVHSGDVLVAAHREGNLALQVLKGSSDLKRTGVDLEPSSAPYDSCQFVALASEPELGPTGWERLAGGTLVSIRRGEAPETEAL